MPGLMLDREIYRDRILGAWFGKCAGITLGAPFRGSVIPSHVNFYQPIPGQPAHSLGLDFPLVWLNALEEHGPSIGTDDLAVAWLEHLDTPQDELAYAILNLRRGLAPPSSGAHSNWFSQSTAAVSRADLWAMLCPGSPQTAAAYAYHDASIDHAAEGVWAAMFLAALGSAAVFLNDYFVLTTIGLAMIPRTCRVARSVKAALAAAQRGAGWLEARESVNKEVKSENFTDVAQNMGYITIGLLYGIGDFGGSICAGVNCGGDTEVVGGAIGAVLGLQRGKATLPESWLTPIGDVYIPTSALRDIPFPDTISEVALRTYEAGLLMIADRCHDVTLVDAPTEAPINLSVLLPDSAVRPVADEVPIVPTEAAVNVVPNASESPVSEEAQPEPVSAPEILVSLPIIDITIQPVQEAAAMDSGLNANAILTPQPSAVPGETADISSSSIPAAEPPMSIPASPDLLHSIAWADSTLVKPLLVTPAHAVSMQLGPFEITMDPGSTPAIAFGTPKRIAFTLVNRADTSFTGRISLLAPSGWRVVEPSGMGQRQFIAANQGIFRTEFTLHVIEGAGRIELANAITLRIQPEAIGAPVETNFLLLGASCWWTAGPFANFDGEGFDRQYAPEGRSGLRETYVDRTMQSCTWQKQSFPESVLELEPLFKQSSGIVYGQTILRSPTTRDARITANSNCGVKVWLNGTLIFRRHNLQPFHPELGSGPWAFDVQLQAGDNQVMVKWVRSQEPSQFSLTVSDRYGRGLPEVGNTSW